jgi:hypothetical protein
MSLENKYQANRSNFWQPARKGQQSTVIDTKGKMTTSLNSCYILKTKRKYKIYTRKYMYRGSVPYHFCRIRIGK